MSTNNNEKMNNLEPEKKNFTDVLSDKAEKAGESAGEAVKKFTEMLTNNDNKETNNAKDEVTRKNTEKLVSSVADSLYVKNDESEIKSNDHRINSKRKCRLNMIVMNSLLVVYDAFAVVIAYFLALWFRFDCEFSKIPRLYIDPYLKFIPFYVIICITVFTFMKLYKSLWEYVSVIEALRVVVTTGITGFYILFSLLFSLRECLYHIISMGLFFSFSLYLV